MDYYTSEKYVRFVSKFAQENGVRTKLSSDGVVSLCNGEGAVNVVISAFEAGKKNPEGLDSLIKNRSKQALEVLRNKGN